ncbi:hypothetical protein I350_00582 [Cryptococcus amylolentus CBS 6273]|uniref:Uncharacterized protein n=1 Tax=Cryptococcus amylolentus CBS 6273 TaxID=1296118 RepID=A0A1E3KFC9_9TREE|nr:hypothetical protein I350_00582 [Cryptococcus amylolentus CBS 6273]
MIGLRTGRAAVGRAAAPLALPPVRPLVRPSLPSLSPFPQKHLRSVRLLSTAPIASSSIAPQEVPLDNYDLASLDPPIPSDFLSEPATTIFDPLIHPLADAFLAIPHPLGYGASIIAITLLVRTGLTLPLAIWQRKRAKKIQEVVIPELKRYNDIMAQHLAREYRSKNLSYSEYTIETKKRMYLAQKALHKKHNTVPWVTNWVPLLVHLPFFLTISMTIRRALDIPGSSLAADSFFWIEQLGQVDPYGILPLLGMGVAFGNAEMVGARRRAVDAAKTMAEDSVAPEGEAKAAQPEPRPTPVRAASPVQPVQGSSTPRSSSLFARGKPTNSSKSPKSSPPSRPISTTTSVLARPHTKWKAPSNAFSEKLRQEKIANGMVTLEDEKPSAVSPERQEDIKRDAFAYILRFMAIGFGMLASQMPSGVVLYWIASICYSFVQNFIFRILPRWRDTKTPDSVSAF